MRVGGNSQGLGLYPFIAPSPPTPPPPSAVNPFTPVDLSIPLRQINRKIDNSQSSSFPLLLSGPPPVTGAQPFPRIGVQMQLGSSFFPTANLGRIAQYQWILVGGNYPAWPSLNGSNGGFNNRNQVVQGLKNQTLTGRNAVLPIVGQYENMSEINPASPWATDWANAVAANNWYCYASGTSGAKTPSAFNSSWLLANPARFTADTSTGLFPYELAALIMYKRFWLGTSSDGAAQASTALDFFHLDNQNGRNLAGGAADWERNGTNPSQTDPTATNLTAIGKADFAKKITALNSALLVGGNCEWGYNFSAAGAGGLGMVFSGYPNQGFYTSHSMTQFMYGSAAGQSNVLNFGGVTDFMIWYRNVEAGLIGNAVPVLTGGVSATDYQQVWYSLGCVLMRNAIAVYGLFTGSNQGSSDTCDPGNSATWPQFDIFWGGSLNLAGWLGKAALTAQGNPQTAAWLNGVWRRDFINGTVLMNPANNGSKTITLAQLGGGPWFIVRSSQRPTVGTGAQVTVSVTLAAGDSLFLMNSPVP